MRGGMTQRTPLYIVCSPRPGVGKTLLSRLLTDFFLMEGRPVAAFDFDGEGPALRDYLPEHTTRASVAGIRDQMTLFDRLIVDDKMAKVVDVAPASFEPFFAVLRQIDFVHDARRRAIEPVTLFITAADRASAQAYAGLQSALPEMILVPVYNEATPEAHRSRKNFPLSRAVSVPMHIPALIPLLQRYIQKAPFSFAAFRGAPPANIPLDAYMDLHRWMRRAFVEFRELELRLLLSDVQASLSQDGPQG